MRELSTNDLLSRIIFLKAQYRLTEDECMFTYFFDGIGEVDSNKFLSCISSIITLNQYKDTFSIFFSSRLDTTNYFMLINKIKLINKFLIEQISNEDKLKYININAKTDDINKLQGIVENNSKMFCDIFSLNVLCNNSDLVSSETTIVELIDLNVRFMEKLNYNNIVLLNLPIPKQKYIRMVVANISYEMAKKSVLRISIKDIQKIIEKYFSRLDYLNINKVVEVLLMMFFDSKEDITNAETFVMFKHKRYYEYFLYEYLKEIMYEDVFVLRDLDIFSQREFFISFLLTQEIKDANRNKDFYKRSFLGFIVSRLTRDYCEPYYNNWINENDIDVCNEITYYDKVYVDYLSLLSKDEIETVIKNDELIFNAFINTHNNSLLLYSYLLNNSIDLFWIYNEIEVDFNNYEEENAYYYMYKYLKGEFSFEQLKLNIFNYIDDLPEINEKNYIPEVKNNSSYNLRIIIRHLIEYDIDKICQLIQDDKMNINRFNKFCYILLDDKISWIFSTMRNDLNRELKQILNNKLDERAAEIDNYICIFAVDYLIKHTKKKNTIVENFVAKHNVNHLMTWKNYETLLSILSKSLEKEVNFYHLEYGIIADVKEILLFYEKNNEKSIIEKLVDTINGFSYDWSNFFTYNISIFISEILVKLEVESSLIRYFVDNVFNSRINKFVVIYNIFCMKKTVFLQAFDISFVNDLFNEIKGGLYDYDTLCQYQLMYSNILSLYDKDLFYMSVQKSLSYSIFRPRYSKENIISLREPMALYLMITKNLISKQEQEYYLKSNLLQLDVIRETLYRSYYPEKLKYLYKMIEPSFEYSFDDEINSEVPITLEVNTSLKSFDSDFLDSKDYDKYNINSFDFWCECIRYLICNEKIEWIYNFLKENKYPFFSWNPISSIAYLIIGAMLKNNINDDEFYDCIFKGFSSDSYYQFLFALIYSGDNVSAKKMFESSFKLVSLMTFYDRRHFESSDYKVQLKKVIMNLIYNSKKEDYIEVDNGTVLLYEKDNDIYIKLPDFFVEDEVTYYNFVDEWAKFYNHTAKFCVYSVFYKRHIIDLVTILSVDEGRAYIPILNTETGEFNDNEYKFCLLICNKRKVDEYIQHAKYNILKIKNGKK